MIDVEPKYHGKLMGIYDEPHSFKEVITLLIVCGIPFALVFALMSVLLI